MIRSTARRRFAWWGLTGLAIVVAGASIASAQSVTVDSSPLTLRAALREGDRVAFSNRTSIARVAADVATSRLPLKAILPSVRLEGGAFRTTDPLGAFGTAVQQRRVTVAAFDPARLNYPAAITNVQAGVAIDLPVLNLDAIVGLGAARSSVTAAHAAAEWSQQTTRANIVRAYYAGILAQKRAETLATAQAAASGALRQTRVMAQQGLVTTADQMQAAVRVDELNAQQLTASDDAWNARRALGLLLGRLDGSAPLLPTQLPSDSVVLALARDDALTVTLIEQARDRADVESARAQLASANGDRLRATAAMLPRINGYVRLNWNDPQTLFAGQQSWTVGVLASWSLFGGYGEHAERAAASARTRQARVGLDAAVAQRRLDMDLAQRLVPTAREHLRLAQHASLQSAEAHRLVSRRYAGGLATIAELLAAEAQYTSSALAHAVAQYALIDALTSHHLATGADLTTLIALENAR